MDTRKTNAIFDYVNYASDIIPEWPRTTLFTAEILKNFNRWDLTNALLGIMTTEHDIKKEEDFLTFILTQTRFRIGDEDGYIFIQAYDACTLIWTIGSPQVVESLIWSWDRLLAVAKKLDQFKYIKWSSIRYWLSEEKDQTLVTAVTKWLDNVSSGTAEQPIALEEMEIEKWDVPPELVPPSPAKITPPSSPPTPEPLSSLLLPLTFSEPDSPPSPPAPPAVAEETSSSTGLPAKLREEFDSGMSALRTAIRGTKGAFLTKLREFKQSKAYKAALELPEKERGQLFAGYTVLRAAISNIPKRWLSARRLYEDAETIKGKEFAPWAPRNPEELKRFLKTVFKMDYDVKEAFDRLTSRSNVESHVPTNHGTLPVGKDTSKDEEAEISEALDKIWLDAPYCVICGKKSEFQCSRCRVTHYCSTEHQKQDWPAHRMQCLRPQVAATRVAFSCKLIV